MSEYLMDTKWACGLIICKGRIIIDTAPIFRKFIGQDIGDLHYKIIPLRREKCQK